MNVTSVCVVCWLGVRREAEPHHLVRLFTWAYVRSSFIRTHTNFLSLSLPLPLSRRIKSLDLVCMKELEKKVCMYMYASTAASAGLVGYKTQCLKFSAFQLSRWGSLRVA